jgi:hypothetical protein
MGAAGATRRSTLEGALFTSRRRAFGAAVAPLLLLLAITPVFAAASYERVSGNTVDTTLGENGSTGWWFARDANNAVPYEFNNNQATIGTGSLYVFPLPSVPAKKFIAENFVLETLDNPASLSISFDYFLASSAASASQNYAYLNLYVNFPVSSPTKFFDCRFDYSTPVSALNTWHTAAFTAASTPTSVTTRGGAQASPFPCPSTLAGMPAGSTLRVFALNFGDTNASGNDAGLSGHLDKVVYNVDGNSVTYDFDPEPPQPASKDDCKKGGWMSVYRADGSPFKNQGDCIQYVNTGK